jgi:hypothetical protein
MPGTVLLLAGVMLACLGVVLSLPATGSEVPSALTGADVVTHGGRVANGGSPPQPDESTPSCPQRRPRRRTSAP